MDIEMGDKNVFNTTGSQLWRKVVLLFDAELKTQYSLMRQDRFTVDNIMKYLYGEQISQIPAYYYNKDMQTKYLNFGSSYLYALHGSGEQHIRKWIRERLMYCDTLLGYRASSSDYITLRSSKLGEVYLDVETYIPMYLSIKWRDEANNTGLQTKRVGRGEKVRFTYNMPTATDQEIIVYAGHYLKSLGDVSNLQPTSMLIANADRLTEIECHSPNLINTDLSECTKLQRIDLSDCTALGTGIGAQPILNIQNCKYLRYCNCMNTQLTAIYTMQAGGNLEEIYYPETTQVVQLTNQTYLHTVGIPYGYDDILARGERSINSESGNAVLVFYPDYEVEYTFKAGWNCGNFYLHEYDKNGKYLNRVIRQLASYNETKFTYTPTTDTVDYVRMEMPITWETIKSRGVRFSITSELNTFKQCKNLANVQITNCNAIQYLQYPFIVGDPINFDSLKYVQNLNITNSLSGLNSMHFNGFDKLRNVTLSSLKELDSIGFEDMMPVTTTSTLKNITISDCPLITSLSFNVSSDDYKVAFASNGKLDLGGLQSLKSIECNTSVKGLDTLIIPTSLTDLRFTTEYGDGINDIKNIWSASAVHNNDGFEGIDFQDMTIEFIDMLGLSSMSNAINFHIAPKTQNPNLNTARDGSESKPWFHPIGSIDLSNYTGSMIGMLKGVDLNKLDVVINTNRDQVDLTSLFECATLPTAQNIVIKTNNILAKFPKSVIWDYMFKGCDLSFNPKDITIPNRRGLSLKGMYKDSNITEDLDLPTNLIAVDEMFMNCTSITTTHENWNKTYPSGFTSTNCYKGLPDEIVDEIPLTWGGNGFEKDYTTIFELNLPNDGMAITVNLREDLKGECNTNWGDGSPVNKEKSHTYEKAGRYIVKFRNGYMGNPRYQLGNYMSYVSKYLNVPKYQFHNTGEALPVTSITLYAHDSLESIDWSVFRCKDNLTEITFANMKSPYITEIDLSELDLSNVTSLQESFMNCKNIISIRGLNTITNKCNNIQNMCYNCTSLEEIVGMETWDMSNCTNMNSIFDGCSLVNENSLQGLHDWDVSSVTNMDNAFKGTGITNTSFCSNWNIAKVEYMRGMFTDSELIEADLSNWQNTNNLKNLGNVWNGLFQGCSNLITVNVTGLVKSSCTSIAFVFEGCSKLTTIIGMDTWNVSNVTLSERMFMNATSLVNINGMFSPIKWNLEEYTGTNFNHCTKLSVESLISILNALYDFASEGNADTHGITLGSTNLAKLTDEQKTIAVNKGWFLTGYNTVRIPAGMDISGFATDNNVTKVYIQLTSENATSRIAELCTKYPNITEVYLFEDGTITEAVDIFTGVDTNIKAQITKIVFMEGYFNNVTLDMREYGNLEELPATWGGFGFSKDVTSIIVVEIPSNNYEMNVCGFPQYNLLSTKTINWGDGTVTTGTNIHTYATAGTYIIKGHIGFGHYIPTSQIKNCLIEVKQLATISNLFDKRSFYNTFSDCTKLTKVTAYNLAPLNCTNMFKNCSSLTEIVGLDTWDMSNCVNCNSLFNGCSSLTEIVGLDTWDMSNCTNMLAMFSNCSSLTEVTFTMPTYSDCNSMFYRATNLINININLKPTDISDIIRECTNLAYIKSMDLSKASVNVNGIAWSTTNNSLQTFNIISTIKCDIKFIDKFNGLTVDGIMNIINNLYDYASEGNTDTHTVQLGSTNLAKLTDEQIAIATNKGWTVS